MNKTKYDIKFRQFTHRVNLTRTVRIPLFRSAALMRDHFSQRFSQAYL